MALMGGALAMAGPKDEAAWTLAPERETAVYTQGEEVKFVLKLKENSQVATDAQVRWRISKDGIEPSTGGVVTLQEGTATVTGRLDEPGFLLCGVTTLVDGSEVNAQSGVAVDPEQIAPSLPVPEDFEAFWDGQLRNMRALPMKPEMSQVHERPETNVVAFDVQIPMSGAPVSGYLAKPRDAAPKSLPAILTLHGAGVRSANLPGTLIWAEKGMLALDINAHGIANGKDAAFYKGLLEGELLNYRYRGRDSRENGYFAGMFLRAVRALDFLCEQPEWDGRNLIVYGGSQGGFQSLAAAALDERVSFLVAKVPAGCDHSGMVAGRVAGWPKMVPLLPDGKHDPAVLEASRYIDAVNFAAKSKAKGAALTVGFIDGTCPPTSVYAAYNALPMKEKKMVHEIGRGHATSPAAESAMVRAVMEHLTKAKD